MNFYDEAIEAKHRYQSQLVKQQASVLRLITNGTIKNIEGNVDLSHLYEPDITALREASPYFWDARITQLVIASGQQLPQTVAFNDSWLIGRAGFWWLGRSSPLIGLSTDDKRYYVTALLWRIELDGLHIASLTTSEEGLLEHLGAFTWRVGEPLDKALTRLSETATSSTVTFRPDLQLGEVARAKANELVTLQKELHEISVKAHEIEEELISRGESVQDPVKLTPEAIDEARRAADEWNASQATRVKQWKEASANALQAFACGSLWLQQKIVVTEPAHLERAAGRRLARANIPTDCLVVHLRSKSYVKTSSEDESNHVDWAWQWAVRGHWRNQPTKDGIKLLWIHPYIKGPDDKPLKPTAARVFAVTR